MHGLERDWKEKVQFFHLDIRSPLGKDLGRRFNVDHLPAMLLVDGAGQIRWRLGIGIPRRAEIEFQLVKFV